jgi:pimeloyl-ACP methyl ester carboxylesterase
MTAHCFVESIGRGGSMPTARASDGPELWYGIEGAGPAVVLLPGRGDSSDLFPQSFTDVVTAADFSVVRMDPRDTGLSGDGGDDYTMSTLAADVVTVMEHAGIGRAHMVGFSMGGIVLVDLASRRPDRVLSCSFVAAMSPDPDAGFGEQFFSSMEHDDAATAMLAAMGSPTEDDRVWLAGELLRSLERAPARPEAAFRHQAAAFRLGWPELTALGEIDVPGLAVHGTVDQSLPTAHAEAFERWMPNCNAEYIDGMGHLPTRREWEQIAQLVVAHLRTASTASTS